MTDEQTPPAATEPAEVPGDTDPTGAPEVDPELLTTTAVGDEGTQNPDAVTRAEALGEQAGPSGAPEAAIGG